jgi:hypothetical protein
METAERRNYPYYIKQEYMPLRGTLGILIVAPSDECPATAPRLASTQALRSRHVSSAFRSFSARPDPVFACRASGLGFVVQPSNPAGFLVNRRKPLVQTPVMSRYPAPAPVRDFVLLFLPPCSPHLTPLAIGSLKTSLLVSPLLGGPARHRPSRLLFTCTNANQTATCTCNTRPRVSPHPIVNHSSQPGATIHPSSDAPILNLPLDECIDNTHK